MIPVKISLTNFMCYRAPTTLDFTGIHIACLSGDNGAGKSALLDAMTWALWGKGRARSDDDFISLGAKEMEVDFEFMLADNRYRVIRRRVKKSSYGQGVLELQVHDGDGWRSITGNQMRETQAKIIGLLRMDYETFINSAFILQGRADEFTVKTPGERKRILAEILGLSYYDRLEEAARLGAREQEETIRSLRGQIQELDAEVALKPQYEAELKGAAGALVNLDREVADLADDLRLARERESELEFKFEQIADLSARLERYQAELEDVRKRAGEHARRLADCERLVSDRQSILQGYEDARRAREREAELNRSLSTLLKLNNQRSELGRAIDEARSRLVTQQQLLSSEMSAKQKESEKGRTLRLELEQLQRQLLATRELEHERDACQQLILERSGEIQRLQSENEVLKKEMTEIKRRMDMLQGAVASCPLCGSDLSQSDQSRILEDCTAEGRAKRQSYDANVKAIETGQAAVQAEKGRLQALEGQLRERRRLESKEALLMKGIEDADEAERQLAAAQVKLVMVTEKLAGRDFAAQEQAALAAVLEQIDALQYDEHEHQAARTAVKDLERFESLYNRLASIERELQQEQASLAEACQAEERWLATLAKEAGRREQLLLDVKELPEVRERVQQLADLLDSRSQQQAVAREHFARAQAGLERCLDLEKTRLSRVKAYDQAAQQKSVYQELATAFGKQGIQAMIIEGAIPEIEEEANTLLARMTEGRMHVKFETQRDTRRGDTIETLDIRLSDGVGTRNYELYSGGEAFRANFAIRIALSKLLARRAGARLQTMVIDEGFGTQDDQGKDRLVEAINSIQDEFEKVIVVTHIQELKDAFPVRIDVTKTLEGSQVLVN